MTQLLNGYESVETLIGRGTLREISLAAVHENAELSMRSSRHTSAEVTELADSLDQLGTQLRPISVVDDGEGRFKIIDGTKRVAASRQAERERISAIVYPLGTPQLAVLLICMYLNCQTGKAVTNEEKRKAFQVASRYEEFRAMSLRVAGLYLGTSHAFIRKCRMEAQKHAQPTTALSRGTEEVEPTHRASQAGSPLPEPNLAGSLAAPPDRSSGAQIQPQGAIAQGKARLPTTHSLQTTSIAASPPTQSPPRDGKPENGKVPLLQEFIAEVGEMRNRLMRRRESMGRNLSSVAGSQRFDDAQRALAALEKALREEEHICRLSGSIQPPVGHLPAGKETTPRGLSLGAASPLKIHAQVCPPSTPSPRGTTEAPIGEHLSNSHPSRMLRPISPNTATDGFPTKGSSSVLSSRGRPTLPLPAPRDACSASGGSQGLPIRKPTDAARIAELPGTAGGTQRTPDSSPLPPFPSLTAAGLRQSPLPKLPGL